VLVLCLLVDLLNFCLEASMVVSWIGHATVLMRNFGTVIHLGRAFRRLVAAVSWQNFYLVGALLRFGRLSSDERIVQSPSS
jgi:hypothetical protein